jgi:flagellar hook-associated protein FlgK
MARTIVAVLAALTLLMVVGCSKVPEQEMTAATQALDSAKMGEASDYAPEAYRVATDTLNAAMALKREADGKFALFRSYGKSKAMFVRAQSLANEAATKAAAEKEKVRLEVTDMLVQAKALLDSADVSLKKAPRGKGSKADIELIKTDLAAATMGFDEATADFTAGKYKVAKAKLEAMMQKCRMVMEEIDKARGLKK